MQVKKHGTFQVGMWTEREREKDSGGVSVLRPWIPNALLFSARAEAHPKCVSPYCARANPSKWTVFSASVWLHIHSRKSHRSWLPELLIFSDSHKHSGDEREREDGGRLSFCGNMTRAFCWHCQLFRQIFRILQAKEVHTISLKTPNMELIKPNTVAYVVIEVIRLKNEE